MSSPAQAQILSVTGDYRVTDVDRGQQRIGIALRDDNPNHRENWVYIKPDTRIILRQFIGHGAFKDYDISFNEAWTVIHKGTKLRVHGGRDWDRSIVAYKIWM